MTASNPARVWITRAEPGASRTAARLEEAGLEPIVRPLLAIEPLSPQIPDLDRFAALAFTSANGVAAFAALTPRRDRPVLAVGDATAQAARQAGFSAVRSAAGDLTALARLVADQLADASLLVPQAETPAGDLASALTEVGAQAIRVHSLSVYRTVPTEAVAPDACDAVLIHSPRAAKALAALEISNSGPTVAVCISTAAAEPLAEQGFALAVSERPDETSLLSTLKAALGKRDPRV